MSENESQEWNFIDDYIDLMDAVTDSPEAFKEATALYLISTCVGRRITLLSLPESRFFDDGLQGGNGKLLNLWFILIGKTRISRKSTIVGRAEEFIRQIDSQILLPQDFTPQSLITNLNEKTVNNETRASWIHDEVSGFFELLNKGDYMVSTDTVLSRIYDGRSYYRSTVTRGNEDVINPYLTILVASTDTLPSLFNERMIGQGFLNRFIYIHGQRTEYRPAGSHILENVRNKAQRLLAWLHTLRNTQSVFSIVYTNKAQEMFEEFEMTVEEQIMSKNLGIEEGYLGNLPNMLSRFAALRRLSRMTEEEIETFNMYFLTIEEQDMRWAINYARKCWDHFNEVLLMMKTYALSERSSTDEREIERVYTIISDNTPVSRSELYRKATLKARRLEEVIQTLVAQDRIRVYAEESSTKPAVMYAVKSDDSTETS